MKAKEYAAKVVKGAAANPKLVVDILVEIINEAMKVATTRHSDASKLSVMREGFQKWRSVVSLVNDDAPEIHAKVGMFLQVISLDNPAFFAQCVKGNVFLGHELDATERAALEQSKKALARLEADARQKKLDDEDARFEKAFGLPRGSIQQNREFSRGVANGVHMLAALLANDVFGKEAPAA
jgi:hypothetical protein